MNNSKVLSALTAFALVGSVHAYEFRCRFVQRIGTTDVVLVGGVIGPNPGQVRNIRLQVGVFDNAASTAPPGGLVGWSTGSLAVSGNLSNSAERRNPGRLAPFNFSTNPNANGNPPLPDGDPFDMLTEIDATLGTQSPLWVCDSQGNIPPAPQPVIRGRNTFVSLFAFSIQPSSNFFGYTVTASGNLSAAITWLPVGSVYSPSCGDPADPSDDIPGIITYAPFPTAPQPFSCSLTVLAPASPSSAALLGIAGALASRRLRRA